ncbi:MAG: putative inorganic carbon (HCO3(-)) transporter [Cellvibrionaceae bacterium]|jgi:putative inorganic carbon (HCO3(-)) transporter
MIAQEKNNFLEHKSEHKIKHKVLPFTQPIGLGLAVLLSFAILFAPVNYLLLILIVGGFLISGMALVRYPVLAVPAVLLIAPLAAYEARAGLPIIGRLPISSGQIVFGGAVILWLFSWLVRKERRFPQAKSFTWLLLFAAVMLITVLSAESTAVGGKEVIKWIQLGAMMLICLDLVKVTAQHWQTPENKVWLLVGCVALSGSVQALIGLSQFLSVDGPESFQILGRFYRAFGTFEQPNPYGGFIAWHFVLLSGICLPQIWQRLIRFSGTSPESGKLKESLLPFWAALPLFGVTALVGGALIASWSRGGWLAAVSGLGAIAFFWPPKRRTGALLILCALFLLMVIWQSGLLPTSIINRLASSAEFQVASVRDLEVNPDNYAVLERQAFWQAAFNMFESNIWTGVGFGNYDAAYPENFVGTWEHSLGHAHNYYINLLAETGIAGLIAYLVFWGVILWQMIRHLPHLPPSQRGIALGLIGVWIALSMHHLVDKLYVNNNWLTLGTFLAMQEILLAQPKRDCDTIV